MPSGPSLIATPCNDSLKGSAGGQPRSLDRNERTSAHDGETAVAVSPEVFELRQKSVDLSAPSTSDSPPFGWWSHRTSRV